MTDLNINIDHIATIRQARGGNEPDPVIAAGICELAGATGIVVHLREDRRHAQDRDVKILRDIVRTKLDLEMGANDEIIKIALDIIPDLVTIVPENRNELTTEGGLNVANDIERFTKLTENFHNKNIEVSFFIEPDQRQIDSVLATGADMIELHTGLYANLKKSEQQNDELKRIINAAKYASRNGLKVAAGHGLNYFNTFQIASIKEICELSIGHSIIAKAVMVGLDKAVRDMIDIIAKANSQS